MPRSHPRAAAGGARARRRGARRRRRLARRQRPHLAHPARARRGRRSRANRDVFAYTRDAARTRVTHDSTDNEEQSSWSPDGRLDRPTSAATRSTWRRGTAASSRSALTKPNDGADQQHASPLGARTAGGSCSARTAPDPSVNVGDVWEMDSSRSAAVPGEPSARPLVDPSRRRALPDVLARRHEAAVPRRRRRDRAAAGTRRSTSRTPTAPASPRSRTTPRLDSAPAWSPDGTRIAWESLRDGGGDREIFVMDARRLRRAGSSPTTTCTTRARRGRPTGG